MAAKVLEIADALVIAINGATFSAPYSSITASREYEPQVDLADLLNTLKVHVVPAAEIPEAAARSMVHTQRDYDLDIGIMRKPDPMTAAALDQLVLLAQEVMDFLRPLTLSGARCTAVRAEPLWVTEHIKNRRQFTSVLRARFRLYR